MTRAVTEWKGKHDDSRVPPRVKDRILNRQNDRCACCSRAVGGKLKAEFDHRPALINGGENRESKIFAVCRTCHGTLTKLDVAEKSAVATKRKKHIGLTKAKRGFRGWRKFNGELVWREPAKSVRREA